MPAVLCVAIYVAACARITIPSNGLASTPPMGWSSWNAFGTRIDDATVRATADAIAANGMREAGYIYVNIDDGWQGTRDSQGNLRGNPRFPDMGALAAYIHSKGLKLGIYSSPGKVTCSGYIGSYGYEKQDAATFAAWGIDYLKYDWCSASDEYADRQIPKAYQKMADALRATGRPIAFSVCEYGVANVTGWAPELGANLWRTSNDIKDSWQSVLGNVEMQAVYGSFAGPGHWNDPDMLEVGNGSMSDDEYRTHMSLWALSAAPLIAGNDLRTMSAATASTLLNAEVIAIDQDSLGKQATMSREGMLETWTKPLADGSVAVGFVNLDSAAARVTIDDRNLGLNRVPLSTRDLWAHDEIQFVNHLCSVSLPQHGVLLLKASTH
jgi:alpha-galactosidase